MVVRVPGDRTQAAYTGRTGDNDLSRKAGCDPCPEQIPDETLFGTIWNRVNAHLGTSAGASPN